MMRNEKTIEDPVDVTLQTHPSSVPERRWFVAITHRWPTWLAITMAAVLAPGTSVGSFRVLFHFWPLDTWPLPFFNTVRPHGCWRLVSSWGLLH